MTSAFEQHKIIKDRFIKLYSDACNKIDELDASINEVLQVIRDASTAGDLSENAAYSEAQDDLSKRVAQKMHFFNIKDTTEKIVERLKETEYKQSSVVTEYSTVIIENMLTNDILSFSIFPSALSNPVLGILSTKCRAYGAMQNKSIGDTFYVKDKRTGRNVVFEIKDIY